MINKIPITEKGLNKLRQELNNLITVERPNNIKAIEEARAHGDLSENAEYHASKERQSFIVGRIYELEDVISRSEVIEIDIGPFEEIIFGATIKIEDTFSGNISTYQLVGPYESDPDNNRISVFSPIGKALIGKEECDVVKVKTPSGVIEYEILEVK